MKLKRLTVPCAFETGPGKFGFYLGRPAAGFHPFHFQNAWLRDTLGGVVAEEIMAVIQAGDLLEPQAPREDPEEDPV